jgi:transposase InsO family protein
MNVDKHTRRTHNKMDSSHTEQKTNKNMDSSHTEQKTNKTTASTINNIRLHARPPPGDTIHVDLKHMPVSMDNNQYLCMFTDAATRVSTPIALRTKDSFKTHYEDYLQFVHNQTGRYPKHIISDGGGEFIDLEVKDINNKHGITHTFTSPHSSAQNSVAERPNRTVSEGSISLLLAANLSASFWEYTQ